MAKKAASVAGSGKRATTKRPMADAQSVASSTPSTASATKRAKTSSIDGQLRCLRCQETPQAFVCAPPCVVRASPLCTPSDDLGMHTTPPIISESGIGFRWAGQGRSWKPEALLLKGGFVVGRGRGRGQLTEHFALCSTGNAIRQQHPAASQARCPLALCFVGWPFERSVGWLANRPTGLAPAIVSPSSCWMLDRRHRAYACNHWYACLWSYSKLLFFLCVSYVVRGLGLSGALAERGWLRLLHGGWAAPAGQDLGHPVEDEAGQRYGQGHPGRRLLRVVLLRLADGVLGRVCERRRDGRGMREEA